jgi:putative transposase
MATSEEVDLLRRSVCKSATEIRKFDLEYKKLNAQSIQVTLKRLDEAFGHFFRRVKAGETPGFPRFKAKKRFPGFGFKTHGDGFRFTPGPNWKHGKLRLSGIGMVRLRGEARTPGRPVACAIQREADGWYLSLVLACEPHRERVGDQQAGMDWGVETFLTLAYADGVYDAVANERFLKSGEEDLLKAQRALSRALRGKRSKTAAKKRVLLAKRARKIAN